MGCLYRLGELRLRHWFVIEVEPGIEQLAHPRFHHIGQLAGDDYQRLLERIGHAMLTLLWVGAATSRHILALY